MENKVFSILLNALCGFCAVCVYPPELLFRVIIFKHYNYCNLPSKRFGKCIFFIQEDLSVKVCI